jgi:hypothetical protein
MAKPLAYEPTFPPDRLHLKCDPAGFTLTLPRRPGLIVVEVILCAGIGVALGWWGLTMNAPGRMEASLVWFAWWASRVFVVGGAVVAILAVVQMVRNRRTPTTLSLHRDVLACTTLGILGPSTRYVAATEFAGADITEPDPENGGRSLYVRRRDGGTEHLFNLGGYPRGDVEYAAEVLKEWLGDAAAIRTARACEGRPCPRCGSPAVRHT